ncbi:MAG: cytochrome c, partial [Caldilineaceae bacterium]
MTGLTVHQAWAQDQSQSLPTPPPFDPAAIPTPQGMLPLTVLATSSYAQNCAPCHGETGNSDGPTVANLSAPPPKFSDPATIMDKSPAEYFHIVKYGRIQNLMPPWGNRLSDEEIWQVVYYAWS